MRIKIYLKILLLCFLTTVVSMAITIICFQYVTGSKINNEISQTSIKPPLSATKISHLPVTKNITISPDVKLIEYTDDIPHIFFHCLIAFPEINYANGSKGIFDTDCVLPSEFNKCLYELYANNYILVDINSTYEIINGKARKKNLMVPEGKKPIILSIDDMVYDSKKMGQGMVDKIILDENGNFATYTKHKNGEEVISYDNEVIPLLEKFIAGHPDFSYNNARATLAVTGWEGILGYRISHNYPDRESEIQKLLPIIQKLKDKGWNFASHGYGHRRSRDISYNLFKQDTQNWHDEIESVIGKTNIYIYPYGQTVPENDPKYQLMLDYGFSVMCGVSTKTIWNEKASSLYMSRYCIDGYSLRYYKKVLEPFFNIDYIRDTQYRK